MSPGPLHGRIRVAFFNRPIVHAQGIIHRDIKPDNLILTDDDVLKIVDFGVSEMFEKTHEMMTRKSAGSPAFLPPELCQIRHGDVSGTAADVWSMGVTLYCLKYGKLPFTGSNVLDMYEAIREKPFSLPGDEDPDFVDLITRILDKNSNTRITLPDIRVSLHAHALEQMRLTSARNTPG